jgi:beta-glucanase (GH16 family)
MSTFLLAVAMVNPWKLVWSDEFNGRGGVDPAKWTYEEGYLRNQEAQYYTKDRRENARQENGRLIIEARKDNWEGKPITSASLTTEGKAAWTYGRIEVRAKLPKGRGTWPAIWTLGTNIRQVGWPKCGEIDILENVGFDLDRIHHTVHTEAYNHTKKTHKAGSWVLPNAAAGFHTYTADWDEKKIVFLVDGVPRFTFENDGKGDDDTWPFHRPQYLILNLAIGGSWGGQQGIDDALFPAQFEIDYVRVYQRS